MSLTRLKSGKIVLVTGASRSGKSEFAEILATKTDKSIVYIATATVDPTDLEWQARIARHQQRRPENWQTLAISDKLPATITQALSSECLLIDSLGTWVANFLDLDREAWLAISAQLLASLQTTKAEIVLVAEETGWGVVPAYKSARVFRDRLGHLSRQIGGIANTVYLVTGGHVLNLSLLGEPLSNYGL